MYERRNIENVIKEEELEKVREKGTYRGSKKRGTYLCIKIRKGKHIESKKGGTYRERKKEETMGG
jgi:hypothetical protein